MGIPITPDQVQTVEVLPGTVPKEAVFADLEEVVGKTPRERILGGEPIRTERLAQRDARFGLNAVIMPGRRAMTIETDSESNIAGFLLPGSFVDVIVTIRPDERLVGAKWLTETILQQIKVLAVGDSMEGGATNTQATSASNKTAKADGKAGDKRPSCWPWPPRRAICTSSCAATSTPSRPRWARPPPSARCSAPISSSPSRPPR
jgi:Flp pilus assembly protein CpaB